MSRRAPRGFTLLETVVALAILALALMAIFDLNAGAVSNHTYTKKLTVATLLARSKMTDLEQELHDEGFSNDDDEESGDFSEEGWGQFKWRARILAPQTQGVSPEQMVSAIFNVPLTPGEGLEGMMGALGGGTELPPGATQDTGGIAAAMGPLVQGQFTQMVDQITKSVREVHLTVSWRDGTQVESFDLVTHVVSLGPGSDRNGGAAAEAAGGGERPGDGGSTMYSPSGEAVPQRYWLVRDGKTYDSRTGLELRPTAGGAGGQGGFVPNPGVQRPPGSTR